MWFYLIATLLESFYYSNSVCVSYTSFVFWRFVFLFFSVLLLCFPRTIVFFVSLGKLFSSSLLLLHHCFFFFCFSYLFIFFHCIEGHHSYCFIAFNTVLWVFVVFPFASSTLSLPLSPLFTTIVAFMHKVGGVFIFLKYFFNVINFFFIYHNFYF